MWVAMLFVLYANGVPYAEADVASSHATCVQMEQDFKQFVADEKDVVDAKFSCIYVHLNQQ